MSFYWREDRNAGVLHDEPGPLDGAGRFSSAALFFPLHLLESGLLVVGAEYSLETGEVEFFDGAQVE